MQYDKPKIDSPHKACTMAEKGRFVRNNNGMSRGGCNKQTMERAQNSSASYL